ncbi:hypothetical protein QLQ12_46670 [Actinoplanes sp. NEAU-A12]|uniref:Secreted protein n=1 Tax=Actinoplanes sandaracinus TaxID=3045177 RepID=A0ABT6X256_9ACTN|nr:hypothetical protein [Actinoplanes sandaracinus]MDI6106068.1 hypothetical protein [Actinoplanes sandaracinus]
MSSQFSRFVTRAGLALATATMVLAPGAQGAHAATPVPAHSTSVATAAPQQLEYKGDYYTFSVAEDSSIVVTKGSQDSTTDDLATRASWKVKMSHDRTVALYWAAIAGATGTVVSICKYYMPGAADEACTILATSIMAYVARMSQPGENDCFGFEISTRWGIPPWKFTIGYVSCR